MNALRIIVAVVAALTTLDWSAQVASGEPLTFHFSGEVIFIDELVQLDESVHVGGGMTGSYTFDPVGAVDSFPNDPRVGFYGFPDGALSARIGKYDFITSDLGILIWNDTLSGDAYGPGSTTPLQAGGQLWTIMSILLGDEFGVALNSDALPLDVPDLADFPSAAMLTLYLPGDEPGIVCNLTSLTPEPGSLVLLALGAALVNRRRNRRGAR